MKTPGSLFLLLFVFCFYTIAFTQTVETDPLYPTDLNSCAIIYDATKGNAELKNESPPIYAYTGVITNLSASSTDWRYIIAEWNQNTPKAIMTPLGNNLYQITMQPSIRAFYGVPASETIKKMAFVFRNSTGTKCGREANGADIFADVYSAVFSVNIIKPENKALYLKLNESIPIEAVSPMADSMMFYINNILIRKVSGTIITDTILADNFGQNWKKHWVRIVAKNNTASIADSFFYAVITDPAVAALPSGIVDGITYIDSTQVILSLFAPSKSHCFVIGDFNNWEVDSAYYLNRTPDGLRYWKQIKKLEPRKEYIFQYLVDGTLRIADPYADKISDPEDHYISPATYPDLKAYPAGKTTGIASFLQTAQTPYPWDTLAFIPPKITDLVIYELLIRDFIKDHDYPSLIDTLDYLKRLGINAIELMPVMEFEGNSSWGYNPDFMFAPDKYYGTKDGLKQFIEAAHEKGFAVIFDIVLNHQFGKSPLVRLYWDAANNRPAANSPWFNQGPKHPYNVGYDFNHESYQTRLYCERVLKYWLSEYHIDGYRFDLSKGFTQKNSYPDNVALWGQYDASRINTIQNYQGAIRSVKSDAIIILEHFADNDEEKVLSSYGMLLWGNMNYNYNEATMGWNTNSDFSWISYQKRGWTQPHVVGYMESHDEERLAYKNITYGNSSNPFHNIKDTAISLDRLQMAAAFFYTIPGPKMLWQFGELGYDYSINYPTGTSDSRLSPKPIRWDYYSQWQRKYLFNVCSSLIDLKKNQDVFESTDFNLEVNGALKRININGSSMDVTIIGNFDVVAGSINPSFQRTGTWYDYFSGDSINVVNTTELITLHHSEYHLYTSVKLQKPLFTGVDELQISQITQKRFARIYPNPSNEDFNIQFSVSTPLTVEVMIFDLTNKIIKKFVAKEYGLGTHVIRWDLKDPSGNKVNPGIYFCRINYGNNSEMNKMIIQ
jgi:1,4-alpha-glucan branching enzyme